ncbi:transcription initiation factor TFIID subunit 12 [Acrasis kona]|uniref:Transcription initiation factor TFIID subunit 12 n=1 Tax=Acrasis kona TaxID=1008807 RepID=A0AAW2YSL0_9EUKA
MNSNDRNVIGRNKLQEIVNQIDPRYTLEPEVEELLLEVADEFIENVTTFGCALAKHRNSEQLEAKDLQLHLEKNWDVKVPGMTDFYSPLHTFRKAPLLEGHKQRLNLVRRSQYHFQKGIGKLVEKQKQYARKESDK